jgi:hypothetical protein
MFKETGKKVAFRIQNTMRNMTKPNLQRDKYEKWQHLLNLLKYIRQTDRNFHMARKRHTGN